MTSIHKTIKKLDSAQSAFLRVADTVSPSSWQTQTAEGCWSAAEIVEHLITVEHGVLTAAGRVTSQPRQTIPLLKRFHLPLALVESRIVKRKSPVPQHPENIGQKEEMLAELRNVRERTKAFLQESQSRDLGAHRWRHPFLGSLSTYEWFQFLASHQVRHTKQLTEISRNLRECVEELQK